MLAVAVPGGPTVRVPSSHELRATSVIEAVCAELGFQRNGQRHLALKSADGIELAPSTMVGGAVGLTLMPRPSVFVIAVQSQPEPLRFAVTGHVTGAQLASHVSKASGIP